MRIYVDPLVPVSGWRYSHACHLFVRVERLDQQVEALDELDAFARSVGLKATWRHDRRWLYHYDLTARRRIMAIETGAIEVDRLGIVKVISHHRERGIFA